MKHFSKCVFEYVILSTTKQPNNHIFTTLTTVSYLLFYVMYMRQFSATFSKTETGNKLNNVSNVK